MKANKDGIALTKVELRALREFSSKEPTDRDRFGVQFQVSGDKVFARATNGRICLEVEGISDGKLGDNEWFVDQKFLIDGRKLLEGKQVLRLNFSGASLHEATVEENGVKGKTITASDDAAVSKPSFPEMARKLKKPPKNRTPVHCMAIAPAFAYAATLAAAATEGKGKDELLEFFPPSSPDGLVVFEVGSDKETSIIGGILANVTAEALNDEDEDEDEESEGKAKRARKKSGKQPELPGTQAEAAG